LSFLEWLQWVWALCTSAEPFPAWREIGIVSNLAIAVAYYWIPVVMVIVFRRWKREIPFPLIWTGFVAFILACGTSHVVHAFHGLRPMAPYSNSELLVLGSTALVSLATAGAFTMLLPQIMRFTSPTTAAARLQVEVDKATAELRRALELEKLLVREVHHRVKNNLQATASLINLHIRRSKQADVSELGALRDRITAMSQAHEQLQEVSSTPFSTKTLIANLCELHRTAYHREGARCRVVGDDLTVPFEAATSLSLILNEAVSNALKHGSR
jgi:signal transduction histidine kinase